MLPGFVVRMMRRGKYRHKFGQRFGVYSTRVKERLSELSPVWIHAVSVGEVRVAMKLIAEWKRLDPGLEVVLSTTTSTGFALARAELETEWLEVIYNPLDFLPCVKSALRAIKPSRLVLVEAEVWPNLVYEARRLGISAYLVNARLSPRSVRRFRRARFLTAKVFNQLEKLCVQFPAEIAIWESLGMQSGKIALTGSIKYDFARTGVAQRPDLSAVLEQAGLQPGARVLLGASTHDGEEVLLAELCENLRQTHANLFLILVPRHFERCHVIHDELAKAGFPANLRSKMDGSTEMSDAQILLVNSTGELRDWFAFATVAFIGKSLTATGGQNPVEAIIAGKPAIFGPHMENFQILTGQLLEAKGAIQVPDAAGLTQKLDQLLGDEDMRMGLVNRAQEVLATHRGAAHRTVQVITE